jgi:Uma2 family endonuclease
MATYAMYADKALAGPPQGEWTVNDWEGLPESSDGCRYELICGMLYMSTAPSFFHQWIIKRLVRFLGEPAEAQSLGIWAVAPIGVIFSETEAAQPDFVLILTRNQGIIRERRIRGAPDLVVEVLSPGNTVYEMRDKHAMYARAGVPEYGVIDPRARRLSHYRLIERGHYAPPREFAEHESVTFDCLPDLPLHVAQLFAGAPDTEV